MNDDEERLRIGRPHTLGLRKSDFTDVLSVKARVPAHSSVLEAGGVALLVKWLTRTWKRHRHRVVILVDAKAVLGAFAKGRSSAKALQHHTRIVAAYCLAADILPRYVYVPSEDNPADAPSRGHRRRPVIRRHALQVKRKEKRVEQRERLRTSIRRLPYAVELEALMAMELLSSSSGSS